MTQSILAIEPNTIEYDPDRDGNDHALIGISPFNGYFSTQNIENLMRWACRNFKTFDIFTMDGASKYNLIALGYSEEESIKKTNKQDKHLRNKILRGFEGLGFSEDESNKKIVLISSLKDNPRYQELYEFYLKLFAENPQFREDCLYASRSILLGKSKLSIDEAAAISVNYLLQELPVWFNTPYIMDVSSSVFVYKDLPQYWRNICYNYDLISTNQKILIKQIDS